MATEAGRELGGNGVSPGAGLYIHYNHARTSETHGCDWIKSHHHHFKAQNNHLNRSFSVGLTFLRCRQNTLSPFFFFY